MFRYILLTCPLIVAATLPLRAQTALDRLEGQLLAAANQRPQLGLMADERNRQLGVVVHKVLPNSPALRAGFRAGDQIIEIDKHIIRGNIDIANALADKRRNDRFEATVLRGGKALVLTIFLGDPADIPATTTKKPAADELPPPRPVVVSESPKLGISLTPMTAADEDRFPNKSGAIIRSIVVGSLADKHKFPLGGLIVGVDGARVTSPADVAATLEDISAGQEVEFSFYNKGVLSRRKVLFDAKAVAIDAVAEAPAKPPIDLGGKTALDLLEEKLGGEAPEPKDDKPSIPLITPVLPQKGIDPPPTEPAEVSEVVLLRKRVSELEERLSKLEELLSKKPE